MWCHIVRVDTDEARYGIEELADRAGVSRRTVRYYVQRGLLPAPTGLGRGKHYTEGHLARLVQVRDLQEGGVGLAEIAAVLSGQADRVRAAPAGGAQSTWTKVALDDDVELFVRGRRLDPVRLERLIAAVLEILGEDDR